MPNIVFGEQTNSGGSLGDADYEYEYPEDFDLKPGSKFHQDLLKKIISLAQESARVMTNRHPQWREIDRTLTAYITIDDKEKLVELKDERKPVSIVFPYSYAIMETLLSYMMAVFTQDPVFEYEGTGPDDVMGAILMQKVVGQHCEYTKVPLALHTFLRDAIAYGVSYAACTWVTESAQVSRVEKKGFISKLSKAFQATGADDVITEEEVVFEGNKLINIDPYKALPDPNVPAHLAQDGEFFGWISTSNELKLRSEEKNDENMFNAKYLQHVKGRTTNIYPLDDSAREIKTGGKQRVNSELRPVDVINMYVHLIPSEWDLGDSDDPEKWFFRVGADDVILTAMPQNLNHNKFPIVVAAPEFDGYSTTPVSKLEMLYGLQKTLDWLFNSHIRNVRKAINDIFVYDPYTINSKDVENPHEGWLIRTRRPAWGKGVKDSIQQLAVTDVTRGNIADSSWLVSFMQKIGATDDAMMGSQRQGGPERVTKGEFEGTQKGAFNRLERMANIIGWQAIHDMGFIFAAHTQQFMSEDSYINIAGATQEALVKEYGLNNIKKGKMKVNPKQLLIRYDMKVKDGTLPGANYSPVWERMFEAVATNPELQKEFDLVRIFKHIARNNGAQNVEQFVRTSVQPTADVMEGAANGNLVPFDQAGR